MSLAADQAKLNRCATVFLRENDTKKNLDISIDLTPAQKTRLESRRLRLVNEGKINATDSLSLQGFPKEMSHELEVELPGYGSELITIMIFGRPYEVRNQLYIDFKVWRKDDEEDGFKHDRESSYLRRIKLSDLANYGGAKNFVSFLKLWKVALVKSEKGDFQLWSLDSISPSNKEVILRSSDGKKGTFSVLDWMHWNLGIKSSDYQLFRKFIIKGVRGAVIFTDAKEGAVRFNKATAYLKIAEFPETLLEDFKKLDLFALEKIKSLLQEKIPVLITGVDSGIVAAAGPRLEEAGINRPLLILTPMADKFAITHELTHMKDFEDGTMRDIQDQFKKQFPDDKYGISDRSAYRFLTFLKEQRAYAVQIAEMKQLNVDSANIKSRFVLNYVEPILNDLNILKETHPKLWSKLREIAQIFCFDSHDVPMTLLFN